MQKVITAPWREAVAEAVAAMKPDKVFLITDTNVQAKVIGNAPVGADKMMVVAAGEQSKSIETAAHLWEQLVREGATRSSLVINLGGGVVTDLGGFVAATFKRGIRFLNVPTTLLGMADAAIGGKTGIDFMGLKNEVGVFAPAEAVIIDTSLLATLPREQLLSGFAEVVKMAMLTDAALYEELLSADSLDNAELLSRATAHAAAEKQRIVDADPKEHGLRRLLNLGHTAGHAYESYAASIGHAISHGTAVAHGLLDTLEQSARSRALPKHRVDEYREKMLCRYEPLPFGPEAHDELVRLMMHDKKNRHPGKISRVLLDDIGSPAPIDAEE